MVVLCAVEEGREPRLGTPGPLIGVLGDGLEGAPSRATGQVCATPRPLEESRETVTACDTASVRLVLFQTAYVGVEEERPFARAQLPVAHDLERLDTLPPHELGVMQGPGCLVDVGVHVLGVPDLGLIHHPGDGDLERVLAHDTGVRREPEYDTGPVVGAVQDVVSRDGVTCPDVRRLIQERGEHPGPVGEQAHRVHGTGIRPECRSGEVTDGVGVLHDSVIRPDR